MANKPGGNGSSASQTGHGQAGKSGERDRRAAALRANLRRRKDQARGRRDQNGGAGRETDAPTAEGDDEDAPDTR